MYMCCFESCFIKKKHVQVMCTQYSCMQLFFGTRHLYIKKSLYMYINYEGTYLFCTFIECKLKSVVTVDSELKCWLFIYFLCYVKYMHIDGFDARAFMIILCLIYIILSCLSFTQSSCHWTLSLCHL